MEKNLITITLNSPSHSDLRNATDTILHELQQTRKKVNGGSSFRVSTTNPRNPSAMMELMGNLKWWSLDREKEPSPRRGFWQRLGDELNGIFEE